MCSLTLPQTNVCLFVILAFLPVHITMSRIVFLFAFSFVSILFVCLFSLSFICRGSVCTPQLIVIYVQFRIRAFLSLFVFFLPLLFQPGFSLISNHLPFFLCRCGFKIVELNGANEKILRRVSSFFFLSLSP